MKRTKVTSPAEPGRVPVWPQLLWGIVNASHGFPAQRARQIGTAVTICLLESVASAPRGSHRQTVPLARANFRAVARAVVVLRSVGGEIAEILAWHGSCCTRAHGKARGCLGVARGERDSPRVLVSER